MLCVFPRCPLASVFCHPHVSENIQYVFVFFCMAALYSLDFNSISVNGRFDPFSWLNNTPSHRHTIRWGHGSLKLCALIFFPILSLFAVFRVQPGGPVQLSLAAEFPPGGADAVGAVG